MINRHALGRLAKRQMLQRKQQLRRTFPNMLTLGNACFGFLSITQSLQGNVVAAAYCILVAALFDFLDGRVARYLSCVSYMGAELDSLCDCAL
jgi:CDP-diacylglycerol---serine O-phosphatidyltransferase